MPQIILGYMIRIYTWKVYIFYVRFSIIYLNKYYYTMDFVCSRLQRYLLGCLAASERVAGERI